MLGISAGFLWTGAGFIQFAYADEDSKAMYITVQWVLTSLGGTVGAFISFGANFHQTEATGVSNAVYADFIVIMCSAIVVAAFGLKHPEDIVRDDGTHLAIFHPTDFWTEVKGVAACFTETRIPILLPGIFCAEIVLVLMSSLNGEFRPRNLLQQFLIFLNRLLLRSTYTITQQYRLRVYHDSRTIGTCLGYGQQVHEKEEKQRHARCYNYDSHQFGHLRRCSWLALSLQHRPDCDPSGG
jgi:hypothetical protein